MNKATETTAKALAGVGALNWGLVQWLKFDALSIVPTGIVKTVVVGAIAASGAYVLYLLYEKKI